MTAAALPVPAESARFGRALGANPRIERDGGRFGAGVIYGVSLAAVGEALGHEMWLDQKTIDQVTEYANATGDKGLKARFTHPGMSSDGMGRLLGRLHNVRTEGEKSVGDLHLAESARDTPDGNLAEYVLMLTEEDPSAAGLSIVFHHDFEAEEAFAAEHQEDFEFEDTRGRTYKTKRFASPDPRNKNDYPHVRIGELRAADIVDEPAANPDGLFDRSPLARQADAFLSYAAGLTETKPDAEAFSIDGDRAAQFFTRWLTSHGLSIVTEKELAEMANAQTPEAPAAPEITRESLLAEQSRYVEKFGSELGVKWFSEGKSYEEALGLFCDQQAEQIKSLQSAVESAEEKLASIDNGEPDPISTHPGEVAKPRTFASRINVVGSSRN